MKILLLWEQPSGWSHYQGWSQEFLFGGAKCNVNIFIKTISTHTFYLISYIYIYIYIHTHTQQQQPKKKKKEFSIFNQNYF